VSDPRNYPRLPDLEGLRNLLWEHARLKHEHGADRSRLQAILDGVESAASDGLKAILSLPEDPGLAAKEPDDLPDIRRLRPPGPRRLWVDFDERRYRDRLRGGLLGRFAGCTLGAAVEFWSVAEMREWAAYVGDAFPPRDYWSAVKNPNFKRYGVSETQRYTRRSLDGVPVDDDLTYTVLGLLIMEDFGPGFTVADVGSAWVKYLPHGCSAERVALKNLRDGVPATQSAVKDNPYVQWIGADIRSDPWGYVSPGWPERAAEYAYRDSFVSHRRNGAYAAMYFSAAVAAAFQAESTVDALKAALTEVPADCLFAQDVRWALDESRNIHDSTQARQAVDARFNSDSNHAVNFAGMHGTHANINACLTIFGLSIGGDDFTRVIGETVAAGYDNDCTAATAGSIAGTVLGARGIPRHWTSRFHDTVYTYINGHPRLGIEDLLRRFEVQARRTFAS
jgi:ADP-ribosylglycohydrolase